MLEHQAHEHSDTCLQQGLENGSGRDRPVLKLEVLQANGSTWQHCPLHEARWQVAAEEFAERRNYIQLAACPGKPKLRHWLHALRESGFLKKSEASGAAKKQVRRFREAMGQRPVGSRAQGLQRLISAVQGPPHFGESRRQEL